MDYTEQNVQNLPILQTPSDLASPNFQAQLTIPPGQNDYPPTTAPNMTPPGFNDPTPIPALPSKPKASNS